MADENPEVNLGNESVDGHNDSMELSPAQVLHAFKDIWRNERYAPELLPEQLHIVDCLLDQIKFKDERIAEIRAKKNSSRDDLFYAHLQKMENNRVRYMIANYLRCRLEKIQKFAIYLKNLPEHERQVVVSDPELKFLRGFVAQTENLIGSSIEMHFPAEHAISVLDETTPWNRNPNRPKLDSFILVKPRMILDGIVLDRNVVPGRAKEIQTLEEGCQYFLRYETIRHLVFMAEDRETDDVALPKQKLILM